jgi:chromate reductase
MTRTVLNVAIAEVEDQGANVDIIDPTKITLPFPGGMGDETTKKMQSIIEKADGIIFATPEYHGTFSAVAKLIIENLGFPSQLKGKPIVLLGVASGRIGAIKSIEHLRGVCSHVGAIVLPGPTSVANVETVFDDAGNCTDPATEKQVRGLATSLLDYLRQNVCPRIALEDLARGNQ